MDFGKVNLLTDEFIENLFKDFKPTGEYKKERHLFGTAITPVGHLDYTDSILKEAKEVYYLNGEIGTGKTTFLTKVYNKAVENGMDVEVYHYPLIKEKIETVYIKDLEIGITVSQLFKKEHNIDLNKYLDKEKLYIYEEEINDDKKVLDEFINYAILNLKKAKSKHDLIEAYYVPNMRFNEIEDLKDEIIKRILKYEEK